MTTHQIWFITGSSRGFGWALASAVLEVGDSVVATARRPEQLTSLVEQYGQRVLPVALDVTNAAAAQAAVKAAARKTRTGSEALRTVTALVRRIFSVLAAAAERITTGAESRNSAR
jgi:NAD(P)-dependent dehydrogenase (short-subunit alcohol dehydrogenase family)